MEHKVQLENKKYRNWVRAGLGIKYVKEGLEPFCDHLVNKQHIAILDKVKRKHNLATVTCGHCDVRTLQPDHVQTKTRQCPFGQIHCNCQHPRGKIACPNKVCGAIYDEIIQLHASTPPTPYWKNTDAKQWCTAPMAVAKCFINSPGYEPKNTTAEFDCSGLLHMLLNNIDFQQHIKCVITGTDVFSKVRKARNDIFHSDNMELEDTEVYCYIDDMIKLLEDGKEIKHRQESEDAVKKLQELKQEDFIISTTDETEIRRVAMAVLKEKEQKLEQTVTDADKKLMTTAEEEKRDIEGKGLFITSELERTGQKIRQGLVTKEAELERTGQKIRQDLVTKEAELERTGQKIKQDLVMKEAELDQTGQKIKHDLVTKEAELEQTGQKIRQDLNMKEAELEHLGQHIIRNLVINEDESKNNIEQKGIDIENQLTRKKVEATEKIEQKLEESRLQLESQRNSIVRSMKNSAETRKDDVASKERKDFQKKLIKLYERDVTKLTPLPRLHQNKRNVDDMYVPSWMTEDIKNEESGKWKEVNIAVDEIFINKEKPTKCIFVIGGAGSGKSTFCKMLVHYWCMAHSEQEGNSNEPDIVHEMKRFDFLFYVSLRYYSDCDCIEKILKKSFDNPALEDILQNGSSKCLIVLDGLDEWNLERKYISQFQTSGLPGHEIDANYTIITTSRQWKFDVLSLSDGEVGKKINLKGIDEYGMRKLTVKTVKTLNGIHKKDKNAKECLKDLKSRQVSDISHTPLMLQQLVCLWFNDKLRGNSKCAIYESLLDLFLDWKSLEISEIQDPLYVIATLDRNTHVQQYLSHLAYETLFDKNKESTLTFSSSKIIELNIPHDAIKDSLASGILKEERNVSLSENMQSTISFFHKSVQEYLAAVYIASQFKEMLSEKDENYHTSLYKTLARIVFGSWNDDHALTDVGKICVDKYFGSCKTLVDILDQSNIFTMLCGLEPRLLTNVSEYMYNVSLVDKILVKARNKIPERYNSDNSKLIIDIQMCLFNCIEEVLPSTQFESVHSHVYIADIYVEHSKDLLRYCQYIILKNVRSVEIQKYRDKVDDKAFYLAVKHLTKCDQLKVIKLKDYNSEGRIYNEVTTILATNVNTLETVSLLNINERMVSRLVSKLPKMLQLTSIRVIMERGRVPHNDILSLSKFLNQTTRLQYISLKISCEKYDTHMIDLSKHKQLQHVDFMLSSFCMVSCNTDNLETCELGITSVDRMNQVYNILRKADKLKHLSLYDESGLRYNERESRNITDNLIRLLPSLDSLSKLELRNFTFTDNIIAYPCDMKNLKEITLLWVTMSMTTWCKFVDCLLVPPQVVTVEILEMVITDDQFGSRKPEEIQLADAQQYVREKTRVFRVTLDSTTRFDFTTKKT